jgi:thymidylate synthase (FAD)
MKIIEPSFEVLYPRTKEEWDREIRLIEASGRTAYKSEEKIDDASALPFIKNIVKRNHLAVIEFGNMIIKIITDRGVTHEIVRHRLCSFVQESTRYCNYSKEKFGEEITVIKPSTWDEMVLTQRERWQEAVRESEIAYLGMLKAGLSPQQARAVLPNSLKTEIVIKANFREWRHIFGLRAVSKVAHPDMRRIMVPLYNDCRAVCPEIFNLGDPE